MEISAAAVKSLRDKTGVSMGDCKKALVEAGGDEAKAIEVLRKKYAGKLEARADKDAANGRIGAFADGKIAALVELRCETDFVSNNENFISAANAIAAIVVQTGITDVNQLMETKGKNGRSAKDVITEAYGKLQEKMVLARAIKLDHGVATYVHHNGLVGTAVAANGDGNGVAKQICMHIAAQPLLLGLNRDAVDIKEVNSAREIMRDQIKDKPAQMVDKIVSGKLDKWYGERVLIEQPFAMDDKKTVSQVAKDAGITLTGYLKMEVGGKN